MIRKVVCLALIGAFLYSCKQEVRVKPASKLRLEYPEVSYVQEQNDSAAYTFEVNANAKVIRKDKSWTNIYYPYMNATIYLTYQPVENNIDSLLKDAQKLTYEHAIKAQSIVEQMRVDEDNRVYGMFYAVDGEAATQSQFYVTDSLRHFVLGSLYFNAKPNYDSIYPAVVHLQKDIRRIMETIEWEE